MADEELKDFSVYEEEEAIPEESVEAASESPAPSKARKAPSESTSKKDWDWRSYVGAVGLVLLAFGFLYLMVLKDLFTSDQTEPSHMSGVAQTQVVQPLPPPSSGGQSGSNAPLPIPVQQRNKGFDSSQDVEMVNQELRQFTDRATQKVKEQLDLADIKAHLEKISQRITQLEESPSAQATNEILELSFDDLMEEVVEMRKKVDSIFLKSQKSPLENLNEVQIATALSRRIEFPKPIEETRLKELLQLHCQTDNRYQMREVMQSVLREHAVEFSSSRQVVAPPEISIPTTTLPQSSGYVHQYESRDIK